jgi:hypothetical protein
MKKILLILFVAIFIEGCSQPQTPRFQQMVLPQTFNYYLVCPAKYCNVASNQSSPIYPVSAGDLFNTFNQLISEESRTTFTYSIPEEGQFGLVYRSFVFGLPHDVTVQFLALSSTTSTLVIYSQSRYEPYDFGENKRLVERWLQKLGEKVAQQH